MNFTDSPYERMMKQIPRPSRHDPEPCPDCRERGRLQEETPHPDCRAPQDFGPSWPEAVMCRELTRDERKTIRRLVTGMCANYDSDYGCLPGLPLLCSANGGREACAATSGRRCCLWPRCSKPP